MNKILLPLAVIAVSGGYVWDQQSQINASLNFDAATTTGNHQSITLGSATAVVPTTEPPARAATASVPAVISLGSDINVGNSAGRGTGLTAETTPTAATPQVPQVAEPALPAAPLPTAGAAAQAQAEPDATVSAAAASGAAVNVPLPRLRPMPPASVQLAAAPRGQFRDGVYDGPIANAYYGLVHVAAVIQGGRLAEVKILDYPADRRTSRYLNGFAMPALQKEAVQVQSARVHFVSGATLSSNAFAQSLSGALQQARG